MKSVLKYQGAKIVLLIKYIKSKDGLSLREGMI